MVILWLNGKSNARTKYSHISTNLLNGKMTCLCHHILFLKTCQHDALPVLNDKNANVVLSCKRDGVSRECISNLTFSLKSYFPCDIPEGRKTNSILIY